MLRRSLADEQCCVFHIIRVENLRRGAAGSGVLADRYIIEQIRILGIVDSNSIIY